MRPSLRMGFFLMMLFLTGCGYTLQTSRSALLEKEGIRRVYVAPMINNTYKAGVTNIVYNALIKTLVSHRRVTLVSEPSDADAILQGTVSTAETSINAAPLVSQGFRTGLLSNVQLPAWPAGDAVVASEYNASLSCTFSLVRRNPAPGQRKTIWTGSFSRAKPFPASNQLDVPGTTSALINESEFDRALADLAKSMMDDVHESMLAGF